MALSNDTTFSVNRDQLITQAYQLCSVLEEGESPNSDQISTASNFLNVMLKAWQSHGLQLWMNRETTFSPTASQTTYTLGPSGADVSIGRPLKITEMMYRDSDSEDTPMFAITRDEYYRLPDKSQTGTPTQFYFDPQLTSSKLYVWPTPDSTFATNNTFLIRYQKPFDDLDAGTNDFEVPSEWYEAIKYGLALRLAPMVGMPYNERIILKKEADDIISLAMNFDTEQESIYFGVSGEWQR